MAHNISDLKKKLNDLGIRPKKTLGQNFLVYDKTIDKIVAKTLSFEENNIIEIGPGLGALTEKLSGGDKNLKLIELDNRFCDYWREKSFNIIQADALRIDWQKEVIDSSVLVSNLPYQISSSLVIDMSVLETKVNNMVLMFQKEVAQRILAKPKTKAYGLLTVIAQTFWQVEFFLEAGPKDFYPPPSVASHVLVFQKVNNKMKHKAAYLKLVKAAFHQRRKKLINNLKQYSTNIDWQAVWKLQDWDTNLRAEDLSVEDYKKLYFEVMASEAKL